MDWLWSKTKYCIGVILSYCVALARLLIWTVIFFFAGLQRTIFMRSEVVSVDFKVSPLRCDIESVDQNLAYIDKLCMENPDLAQLSEEDLTNEEDSGLDEDEGGLE